MVSEKRSRICEKATQSLAFTAFTVTVTIAGREVAPHGQTHDPGWGGSDPYCHHLWFIRQGKGAVTTPAGEFLLRPGTCFWMRPGVKYAYRWDAEHPLVDDFVVFEMRAPRGRLLLAPPQFTDAQGQRLPLPEVFTPPDPELVGAVLNRLVHLVLVWQGRTAMAHLPADGPVAATTAALLHGLLVDLLGSPWPSPGSVSDFQRGVIHEIAARLLANPAEVHRCHDLARQAGYSPAHFRRLFQRVMGMNPKEYALQAGRRHAERLLANLGLSVTQVAEQLGYPSIFAFSAQFKQLTGLSPVQWRAAHAAP